MGDARRQRAVLYPHQRRRDGDVRGPRPALPVPNWFDLPVLLPESNVVAARMQRSVAATSAVGEEAAGDNSERERFSTPKVSRLATAAAPIVPVKSALAAMRARSTVLSPTGKMNAGVKMYPKRKNSARRLDGLPFDRKSRLRAKLWKDLDRFGLWHFADDDAGTAVDQTVDAIMAQWQDNGATLPPDEKEDTKGVPNVQNDVGEFGQTGELSPAEPAAGVFLTSLPLANSQPCQHRNSNRESAPLMTLTPSSSFSLDSVDGHPELDKDAPNNDVDEIDEHTTRIDQELGFGSITIPGMKRRQRLKDLHVFVETQLQKRLLKSWETIEIAFTGSGDMTISQIVKFLQHSDVQLGTADAAKVKAILEQHATLTQDEGDHEDLRGSMSLEHAINSSEPLDSVKGAQVTTHNSRKPTLSTVDMKKVLFSYEGFRQIFRSRNTQEESRWKREFDRERVRKRQEKEIYDRELSALEERVKQRLAESAKNMVEILDQFRCDPLSIPWESDQQRLDLRNQFLEIIFRRRGRQLHLSPQQNSPDTSSSSCVPEQLSIKLVRSAMLQKYSRNGHFESIEVKTAAYLFHDYVADFIKRGVKTYWKRLETDLWPERQMIFRFRLKKQVFLEWKRFTKHAETLRRYVMRRFIAWKYYTRKRYEYYAFYRTCFWPFYVWKRYLQQMIIARGKSIFLKNLVHTYILLRNFRTLKKFHRRKKWCREQVKRLRIRKARKTCQLCWAEWKARHETTIAMRRLWSSKGHVMQHLHKLYMVKVTFYILRYYAMLKRDMMRREDKCLLTLYSPNLRINKSPARGKSMQSNYSSQSSRMNANSKSSYSFTSQLGASAPRLADGSRMAGFSSAHHMVNYGSGQSEGTGRVPVSHHSEANDPLDESDVTLVLEETQSNVHPLTRIMETEMGQRMKRKSRLYDLCLALYLKYREQDQVKMIANVVIFRRVGRLFLKGLRAAVAYGKKSRFAIDLGAFRVIHARFHQWRIGTICSVRNPESNPTSDNESSGHEDSNHVELHWVKDRVWRRDGIENNPSIAQQLRQDLLAVLANDSIRRETIRDRELLLIKKQQQEESFLRKEAGSTHRVKVSEMQQAQQLLRMRAHRMHDVLDHVYDDLREQEMRWLLRSSFRSIRVIAMMKYSDVLCHRAQLRNWVRICQRFLFWQKHIDKFYTLKIKFNAFRSLFRHAVWKWKFQTPGLSARLQIRQRRMLQYDNYLKSTNLLDGSLASFHLATTKHSPANTFVGVFLRWVQFTQASKVKRQMIDLTHEKHNVWCKYQVFHALKSGIKAKYSFSYRRTNAPFLLRHFEADLDSCHCKIIALLARLPSTLLRARIRRNAQLVKLTATGSPTLKQLFVTHGREIDERLALERRLMFAAYSERRVHHYEERSSSAFGSVVGRAFTYEKAPPYGSVCEVIVIHSSKKVEGLSFVVKTNAGVTYQGALHGNPFGNREIFALSKGEVLTSIEGFASQQVYALRFGTSNNRLSKWYGLCEKGTKFDIRSEYATKREEIVGIFGHADGTSINALGAVMRVTTAKNLFEGLWLQTDTSSSSITNNGERSASDSVALSDRQFSYFLQVRTCEVKLSMQRAHRLVLRVYRSEQTDPALRRPGVLMGIARWLLNALAHGLVHCTDNEAEGQRILSEGLAKKRAGDQAIEEATAALHVVDSYRSSDGQLDAAILGVKKINELREMMEQANTKLSLGKRWIAEGKTSILEGQRILPHLPITKRMVTAVREMYRVVQTKDYIDQMDPDLRAILLLKDGGGEDHAVDSNGT